MIRKILIGSTIILTLCICLVLSGTGVFVFQSMMRVPTPTRVTNALTPTSVAVLPTQVPVASSATADALARTQIPERDAYQLYARLKKKTAALTPVPTLAPRNYKIGDRDQFNIVQEAFAGKYRTASATLKVMTPHSLFWVEDGLSADVEAMQKAADYFEQNIFPTNQKYFGTLPPGLDGELRVHVFCGRLDDYTAGYFSSVDTFPSAIAQYSNQRHLL